MYRDLVFRPNVDSTIAQPMPYRYGSSGVPMSPEIELLRGPGNGGGIVADTPRGEMMSETPRVYRDRLSDDFMRGIEGADSKARAFLDLFMSGLGGFVPKNLFSGAEQLLAGYVPFKGVDPADVDPGGPESPETMARAADYINQLRRSGQGDRARRNLIQRGFPLGGV